MVWVAPPTTLPEGSNWTKHIPFPLVVVVAPFQARFQVTPASVLFHNPLALVPQNNMLLFLGSTARRSPFPRPFPFPCVLNLAVTSVYVKVFPLSVDFNIAVLPLLIYSVPQSM